MACEKCEEYFRRGSIARKQLELAEHRIRILRMEIINQAKAAMEHALTVTRAFPEEARSEAEGS